MAIAFRGCVVNCENSVDICRGYNYEIIFVFTKFFFEIFLQSMLVEVCGFRSVDISPFCDDIVNILSIAPDNVGEGPPTKTVKPEIPGM